MNKILWYIIETLLSVFMLCSCIEETKSKIGSTDKVQQEKGVDVTEDTVSKYLNDYFPYVHNQKVSLAARFLDIYEVEGTATLQFQKVMKGEKGELWKVAIIELDDANRSKDELELARSLYGDLHYFFVTQSEIYWIVSEKISVANKKKICNEAKLPEDSCIICRNKKMAVDREGWHYRIIIESKNIITFSAWFKQNQESSYFRDITFKKNCGIVKFISKRTAAGAESVELWDDTIYYSKEYSKIEMR